MKRFRNDKKERFLANIPTCSLESETDILTARCKFNFAYFEKQSASQSFEDWDHNNLSKLLNKLKDYSKEPLTYWMQQSCGAGKVLTIYGSFPTKSEFAHPKHVPHQASWGRFRLESKVRLVGFIVPNVYEDKAHPQTGKRYDCNTFYVVFLDANHKFWLTEAD